MPKAPPPTVQTGSSLPTPGTFAYNQMLKMGWNPAEGLGSKGRGIKTYVKVVKQKDGVGIGGGGDGGQLGWTGANDGDGLSRALGMLKAVSRKKEGGEGGGEDGGGEEGSGGEEETEKETERERKRRVKKEAKKEAKKESKRSEKRALKNAKATSTSSPLRNVRNGWAQAKDLTTKTEADLVGVFGLSAGKALFSKQQAALAAAAPEEGKEGGGGGGKREREGGKEERRRAKKEKKEKKSEE